jgi:NTP pyrophosphatase (non-canonical NTP hydrolase)
LAIAIGIEAGELNELFLWKTPEQVEDVDKEKVADELSDVLVYSLMLAHKQGFDVEKIIMNKMRKNGEKYPVDKAKGNATKYTDF